MDIQELRQQLAEKMAEEQEQFRNHLIFKSPAEVLEYTYEYTMREDILMGLEDCDLSESQLKALLQSPCPLADIYREFNKLETDHMDNIRLSIESFADRQQGRVVASTLADKLAAVRSEAQSSTAERIAQPDQLAEGAEQNGLSLTSEEARILFNYIDYQDHCLLENPDHTLKLYNLQTEEYEQGSGSALAEAVNLAISVNGSIQLETEEKVNQGVPNARLELEMATQDGEVLQALLQRVQEQTVEQAQGVSLSDRLAQAKQSVPHTDSIPKRNEVSL